MAKYKIAWLPGDGIGIEVLEATRIVLDALGLDAEYPHGDIGWEFWVREGDALPQRTIDLLPIPAAALACLLCAAWARAEPPPNYLLVESPHSQDVQVIDVKTRQVVRNIAIGEHTDDVIGSPDGRVFYVGAQDEL